jgi:hypothetical protein
MNNYSSARDHTMSRGGPGPGISFVRQCFGCNVPRLQGSKDRRTGMWFCVGCRPVDARLTAPDTAHRSNDER